MKKALFLILAFGLFIDCYCQTAEEYSKKGFENWNSQDYKGAIVDYSKAIEINPNVAQYYFFRGDAKNLQDYRGAIEDFTKAIELNPKNERTAYYFFKRGFSKFMLQNYLEAIEDYNRAIELNPKRDDAYSGKGDAKFMLKDYRGAIEDYNKAIAINPKYREAYCNRGVAKIASNQKDSGCLDLSKAGELGNEKAYDLIKKYCN